ncbi:MAG: WD40 repeat domain-containing protein [Anaerolineae bacterium]|nr:WD40 repeat domain-containing protein [Anaerolineae bacterium]
MASAKFKYLFAVVFVVYAGSSNPTALWFTQPESHPVIDEASMTRLHLERRITLDGVTEIEWSPDGEWLAATAGKNLYLYPSHNPIQPVVVLSGHEEQINCIAFVRDSQHIVTGSSDGTARLWNITDGSQLRVFRDGLEVWSIAINNDTKIVATGSSRYRNTGSLRLWNLETGDQITELTNDVNYTDNHLTFVRGGLLASVQSSMLPQNENASSIAIWDTLTREKTEMLTGNENFISNIDVSESGELIASVGWDGTVRVWNIENGEEVALLLRYENIVEDIDFSPLDDILVVGAGTKLAVWRTYSYLPIMTIEMNEPIRRLSFNPSQTLLAVSHAGSTVSIWAAD